jgi:hypothetical protein
MIFLNFSSKEVIEEEDGSYKKDFKPKSWIHGLDLITLPCIPIFIFFIKNIIDSVNVYNSTNTIDFLKKCFPIGHFAYKSIRLVPHLICCSNVMLVDFMVKTILT